MGDLNYLLKLLGENLKDKIATYISFKGSGSSMDNFLDYFETVGLSL